MNRDSGRIELLRKGWRKRTGLPVREFLKAIALRGGRGLGDQSGLCA
jgi:hypothetical protein